MVKRYHFVQADVFTGTPFGGNQLAVFTDARGLSADEMQTLAHEMNFSESTFVLPPEIPNAVKRGRILNEYSWELKANKVGAILPICSIILV